MSSVASSIASKACDVPISRRTGMSTFSLLVGSALWCLVLVAFWYISVPKAIESAAQSNNEAGPDETSSGKPQSLVIKFPAKQLPEFEFDECLGGKISRDSMLGKRWLAVFVFTRCVETCPVITRHVSELHTKVAEANPDFQFVTFSVDSSFDTANVLKKYAETFNADHERWKFLTGDEQTIHNLIRTGFTQYVAPNLGEKRKPGFEVAHTNRAVLVNEDGIPVATYLMTDPEDVVRLRRVIEGKSDFPEPSEGTGFSFQGADGNPAVEFQAVPAADSADAEQTKTAQPPTAGSESESALKTDVNAASDNATPKTSSSDSSSSDAAGSESGTSGNDVDSAALPKESAEQKNERIETELPNWVAILPTINAGLNSMCTILLLAGYSAIRLGRRNVHRNLMVTAFAVSVVFLGCYLTYHEALFRFTGERGRAFVGSDWARQVYFGILIPHVILAVFVPILALRVFFLSWRERWPEHRRLAKITLPIWLFVSITGVVIYGMLYHWPWRSIPSVAHAA